MAQCNCNPLEVQLENLILAAYPHVEQAYLLVNLPKLVVEILQKTNPDYAPYKDCPTSIH